MRDYIREMLDAWTNQGEQAAYELASQLLQELRNDVARLQKLESAILALGQVLREHPAVDVSADPADPRPGLDRIEPAERPTVILEAAGDISWEVRNNNWNGGQTILIKTQDVLNRLRSRGLDLGVQQPLAVIGTVLASAKGFKRIARNTFEVIQDQDPMVEPDDLPF